MNNIKMDPLLIPSFSSKGSPVYAVDGKTRCENFDILLALEHSLYHSYLISAYDIYYGLMSKEYMEYPLPDVLMVDSGGYETNNSFDMSEQFRTRYAAEPWNRDMMLDVYGSICSNESFSNTKLMLSTFDCYGALKEQLLEVGIVANAFPTAQVDFLIHGAPTISDILPQMKTHINELRNIGLIGFTEKELGSTLLEKLRTLIEFCTFAKDSNWPVRIHIYGGLEPNALRLFFWAGASVFDGLSWQKFRYRSNSTLYSPDSYFIHETDAYNKLQMMMDNIAYLQQVEQELREGRQRRGILTPMMQLKDLLYVPEISISDIIKVIEGGD